MKRLFYIVLLCTCCIPIHSQLLYEVSGNSAKAKSYILATNPLVDMQFIDTIPNAFKCFSSCQQVITEFAMQDYEAIAALRQAALLADSIQLKNFYSEDDYTRIDHQLQLQLGLGLEQLGRMKPSYLSEMVRAELLKTWLHYDEQRSMATFFQNVATERNIPVIGLDNIGETMYMLFDREPFHHQCQELLRLIDYPEREVNQARTLKQMYLMGHLTDMAYQIEGPSNLSLISYSDYQVFAQRNTQWVKRLHPYLKQGKCFITLDAIYLGGEKGLLAQLRQAGYRIRPVNRHQWKHINN